MKLNQDQMRASLGKMEVEIGSGQEEMEAAISVMRSAQTEFKEMISKWV
jgi:hypothetical protein